MRRSNFFVVSIKEMLSVAGSVASPGLPSGSLPCGVMRHIAPVPTRGSGPRSARLSRLPLWVAVTWTEVIQATPMCHGCSLLNTLGSPAASCDGRREGVLQSSESLSMRSKKEVAFDVQT